MTDIATNLNTIDGSLSDIKTAIVNKGGTVSGNITTFATAIDNIPSGGGGGKYALLDRVSDDNGNEIGTVSGFFTDANDVEYAVVCLDAIYRNTSVQWSSNNTDFVTNMPSYTDWTIWEAPETATENTTLILASFSSSACTHCRQYSFIIDGITYYGQFPNAIELTDIAKHRTAINNADTSDGSIMITTNNEYWASNQYLKNVAWCITSEGSLTNNGKLLYKCVCPVLEIPNI